MRFNVPVAYWSDEGLDGAEKASLSGRRGLLQAVPRGGQSRLGIAALGVQKRKTEPGFCQLEIQTQRALIRFKSGIEFERGEGGGGNARRVSAPAKAATVRASRAVAPRTGGRGEAAPERRGRKAAMTDRRLAAGLRQRARGRLRLTVREHSFDFVGQSRLALPGRQGLGLNTAVAWTALLEPTQRRPPIAVRRPCAGP